MPFEALAISNANLRMMRTVLDRECAARGLNEEEAETIRLARLVMGAYCDGVISEADLSAMLKRDRDSTDVFLSARFLKDFPTSS